MYIVSVIIERASNNGISVSEGYIGIADPEINLRWHVCSLPRICKIVE